MNIDPVIELLRGAEPPGAPAGPTQALSAARSARRRRRAGIGAGVVLASTVVVGAVTVSWGSENQDSVVPATQVPPSIIDHGYADPAPLVDSKPDPKAPLAVPTRARDLLECYTNDPFVSETADSAPAKTAQGALGAFARADREFPAPKGRYLKAGSTESDILYTARGEGRIITAVIVAKGSGGWTVRSYGVCNNGMPPRYVIGPPFSSWTDSAGRPADEKKISSYIAASHCDYQAVTTLTLNGGRSSDTPGRRVFVRDPEGLLPRLWVEWGRPSDDMFRGWADAQRGFEAYANLPADAVDTGYRRGGVRFWVTDHAAYLVGSDRTERWAEVGEGPLCL